MMFSRGIRTRRYGRLCLLCVIVIARSASAQDATPSSADSTPSGRWVPLGSAPVDQAGAGRRGYVLPGEDSDVAAVGSNRFAIHAVAANSFYREQNSQFLVSQRYETHTIGVDFRRGFKVDGFPRFEIGGQIQLHERDGGVLNGFILNVERFWASLTGYEQSTNQLRTQGAMAPPLGISILRDGSPIYRNDGGGSGIGDVYASAKAALLDGDPSSNTPRVSARIGINAAGSARFSQGHFVGVGVSLDQKLSERVAFHADVRATQPLDRTSVWNLSLRRWVYGFSAGPEFRLGTNSSLNLQVDGSSTPYQPTGTLAFDRGYGALTFGLGRRFGPVVAQLYVRENMDLPFKVRWNTDPDLSVGLKFRIH